MRLTFNEFTTITKLTTITTNYSQVAIFVAVVVVV